MVVVTGNSPRIVECVGRAVERAGHEVHHVDAESVAADRSLLFMLGMQTRVSGVLVIDVEPARVDGTSDRTLAHALASTSAAGMGPLVVVTWRRNDDPALEAIRRDGVPYVIVRLEAPRADVHCGDESVDGRTVLVQRDLAEDLRKCVSTEALETAVVNALDRAEEQGRTIDLVARDGTTPIDALARRGARVVVATAARVNIARWMGQSFLRRGADGDVEVVGPTRAPSTPPGRGSARRTPTRRDFRIAVVCAVVIAAMPVGVARAVKRAQTRDAAASTSIRPSKPPLRAPPHPAHTASSTTRALPTMHSPERI